MAKMIKCKTCGADIAKSAKVCPHCGAKNHKPTVVLIVVAVILVIGIISATAGGGSKNNSTNSESKISSTQTPTEKPDKSIFNTSFDTTDYTKLKAEILYEYGAYLSGEKIVTVATVSKVYKENFRANTENGGQYSYDLEFDFDSSTVDKQVNEGDIFTIAGIIKESSTVIGITSVVIEDCIIIGNGEISEFINDHVQEQILYCTAKQNEYEEMFDAALKDERDEYAATCETVDYNDVARNPNDYKGKQIKFNGKVIQVSEGIFDTVTLRVNENSGNNTWYVTYTHKEGESRILENDWITCYGECDGVKSYMTVLGAAMTIPAMKMKYFNLGG